MIYLIGMSHAIAPLRVACEAYAMTAAQWDAHAAAERFAELPLKPGALPAPMVRALVAGEGWHRLAHTSSLGGAEQIAVLPPFLRLLQSIGAGQPGDVLISMIGGNEHTQSLVQHPQPYDFDLPSRRELGMLPGRQPVPLAAVKAQLAEAMNPTLSALAVLRRVLPGMRLIHVAPPPPIGSEATILAAPEIFEAELRRFGISPLNLRLKYYSLFHELLRPVLDGYDIELLPPPAAALRPDGALADGFTHGCTHGNLAYGELVLQQLRETLQEGPP